MTRCKHDNLKPEVCDQTLGVACFDCGALLGVCWMDRHFSEKLWNRACLNDFEAIKCKQDREDFCGLCGEPINEGVK